MRATDLALYVLSGIIVAYMSSQTHLVKENVGNITLFLGRFLKPVVFHQGKTFTEEELLQYDGKNQELGNQVFISVAGKVFDVTGEIGIYGTNGDMKFAAGRDISFMLGTDHLNSAALDGDLYTLNAVQMWSLWMKVKYFENNFPLKGVLSGTFYDHEGFPSNGLKILFEHLTGSKSQMDDGVIIDGTTYPLCSTEWKPLEGGGFLQCQDRRFDTLDVSGKKHVFNIPVMYHSPGSERIICTCIPKEHLHLPHFHGFRNFDPYKTSSPVVS